MGMDKFYRTVRRKFGVEKEQMKQEIREEVIQELRDDLEKEVSYIEAQMKEYEQLVAEVNHLLATMRRENIKSENEAQVRMDDFGEDLEPLKAKLRQLEDSMDQRMQRQEA